MQRTKTPKVVRPSLILDVLKSSGFLVLNKTFLKAHGPEATVFISNLLDKFQYFYTNGELKQREWFYLTYENQMEQTGMTKYGLRNARKIWESNGVLETKRMGVPAKTYFKINWQRLEEEYRTTSHNEFEMTSHNGSERTIYKDTKVKENKDINNTVSESNGGPSAKERTKKYIPLARQLAKCVQSHIDYKIDTKRIKRWAKDLRLLHEQNGVHPKRMKEVLRWYRKHIGGDYIPQAFSGSSFRDKFPKLEAAIKRSKGGSKGSPVKTAYKEKRKYKTDGEI